MGSAYLRIMMVASGHVITALPAMTLKAGVRRLPIKLLPVVLPTNRRPVRIVTLKNRALSPVAQLFIEHTLRFAGRYFPPGCDQPNI
jgi:DNA-binding transcriptional LysR family regulator